MEFYHQEIEQVVKQLGSDGKRGITDGEAGKRREKYGLNELKIKDSINPFIIFVKQFKSFIIYILLFALIISILVREYIDASVIFVILVFNAFFGFIQEYKAEKSIQALKKYSALQAKVLRNGKIEIIDSKELVPGDVVVIEEGSKIPADGRLIESYSLQILESSLTGESAAVSKITAKLNGKLSVADQKNMVFSGTLATRGRGVFVVTGTGINTEIGKIAVMISDVEKEQTPLQKKLDRFGRWIGLGVLIISFFVFAAEVVKERLLDLIYSGRYYDFVVGAKDGFLTAIALAVAAVPEGLPAIVTISLAVGVRKMLQKNSLVRRLPSVETLGETNIICSDKTGTLTKNEMTVRRAFTNMNDLEISGDGYDANGKVSCKKGRITDKELFLFRIGVLCNNASVESTTEGVKVRGDPTEAALLVSAEKAGVNVGNLRENWTRLNEEPFDSVKKMMSTLNKKPDNGKSYVFSKGAPEIILQKCDRIWVNGKVIKLREDVRKKILDENKLYAEGALRVLGFAFKESRDGKISDDNLIFVGLQGMIDPPRNEVKDYIAKCNEAGIRVIMVTGDNKYTASAIAKEIGIRGDSIEGVEFAELGEKEQYKAIDKIGVFARVEPEHKLRIVNILQNKRNVVSMTGDGVNDAPALKKSDIGIAMGIKGTDVAKESSDVILLDDNFTTIVDSIEEGRGIYENIKKFVNYLLSSNLAEVLVIFLAIVIGWPLPMTAIMLLWINLVTDGLPALALSVDPNPKDLMRKPPMKSTERIMNKSMMYNVFSMGILITIAVLGLFYWGLSSYGFENGGLLRAQTIAFTAIIIMELVRLYSIRSEYKLGVFSNKWLVLAVVTSILLQLVVIYTPLSNFFKTSYLSTTDWIMILVVAAGVFLLNFFGIWMKNRLKLFG